MNFLQWCKIVCVPANSYLFWSVYTKVFLFFYFPLFKSQKLILFYCLRSENFSKVTKLSAYGYFFGRCTQKFSCFCFSISPLSKCKKNSRFARYMIVVGAIFYLNFISRRRICPRSHRMVGNVCVYAVAGIGGLKNVAQRNVKPDLLRTVPRY